MLRADLVSLDMEAKDSDDFFRQMTEKLIALGLVTEGYAEALIKREHEYPTAITYTAIFCGNTTCGPCPYTRTIHRTCQIEKQY